MSPRLRPLHRLAHALCLLALLAVVAVGAASAAPLPERLSATGLFETGRPDTLRAGVVAFAPQYPLWSDGADKRRWIALPPGRSIDARRPDGWDFPAGTRLWKEFAHGGRPVETRFIERLADGRWRFASYVWAADGREAWLAPPAGATALPVDGAPAGRYDVPSRDDCRACHESAPVPVLGASAVQLAPVLAAWAAAGRLRHLPVPLRDPAPRIAAASDDERAALGVLHANCGHCHNRSGNAVPLPLTLAQRAADPDTSRREVLAAVLGPRGTGLQALVEPGAAARSLLVQRMASRNPQRQMPPLGTRIADTEGLALVTRWIDRIPHDPASDFNPDRKDTLP